MKYFEVVLKFLLEEKGASLLLLDVDDTLVLPKNIFIYKKNADGTETALTPDQFAKEPVGTNAKYDFREFRTPEKVYNSIKTGIPIIPNLKVVDEYIRNGWKIGILTARGMEDVVYKGLKDWLMYRDKKGNLQDIGDKLVRDLVHAINDENRRYKGETSFEKKAEVIRKLATEYDRVVFIDDDMKNLEAVRKMGLKNVYPKLAQKAEKV